MKLFVDDIRACPEGWTPARTVTEAIRILATQSVEEISLDHDIECHNVERRYVSDEEVARIQPYCELPVERHEIIHSCYHASKETFEAVAWFVALWNKEWGGQQARGDIGSPIMTRIHTSNIEKGKDMAKVLGIPYVFTHYPYDFRKDRDVKEPWENDPRADH